MKCRNSFNDSYQSDEIPAMAVAAKTLNEEIDPTLYADLGTSHMYY